MSSLPYRRILLLLAAVAAPALAADASAAAPPDASDIVPLKKATFFIYEDFESTDVGKIPKGFTSKGSVGVVDDVAHTGKHSLRLNAAVSGARQIVKQGAELAAMGGEHDQIGGLVFDNPVDGGAGFAQFGERFDMLAGEGFKSELAQPVLFVGFRLGRQVGIVQGELAEGQRLRSVGVHQGQAGGKVVLHILHVGHHGVAGGRIVDGEEYLSEGEHDGVRWSIFGTARHTST